MRTRDRDNNPCCKLVSNFLGLFSGSKAAAAKDKKKEAERQQPQQGATQQSQEAYLPMGWGQNLDVLLERAARARAAEQSSLAPRKP